MTTTKSEGPTNSHREVPEVELPSTREDLRRVLTHLFSEEHRTTVEALREELQRPGYGNARQCLTALNQVDGRPQDPRLNDSQLHVLKAFLTEARYRAVSPESSRAMRFWRELLSKQPGEVRNLHLAVSDYRNTGSASHLEAVLQTLRRYVPDGAWSVEDADALKAIHTESIEFKHLAWFPFPEDCW